VTDTASFLELIRDELGLPLAADALDQPLLELEAWDSVYLLRLVTALESATGARISVPALMRAGTLRELYAVTQP
jgi:hypothetical protein